MTCSKQELKLWWTWYKDIVILLAMTCSKQELKLLF